MEPGELSATTTVINQAGSQGSKLGEVTATSKSKGGIVVVVSRHMPRIGLCWSHCALVASESGDANVSARQNTN